MHAAISLDPSKGLRHPLWWGSLALLVVNDHLLKGAGVLPVEVTGKLSDAAGLVVAPLLVAALSGVRTRRALLACHVGVLALFAWLKLSPSAAAVLVDLAAFVGESWAIAPDPTDLLVAVPAATLAFATFSHVIRVTQGERVRKDARALVLAMAGALGCGATSRIPPQAPAVGEGRIVAQAFPDDSVHAVDVATGQRVRKLDLGPYVRVDPPVLAEGAIWFTHEGDVRAIDIATGAEKWALPGSYTTVHAVDAASVYVATQCVASDCSVTQWTAIARETKAPRWTAMTTVHARPVVTKSIVILAEEQRLVARDVTSGATLWSRTLAGEASALAASEQLAWVADVEHDALYALDARTGAEHLRLSLPTSSLRSRGWERLRMAHAEEDRLFVRVDQDVRAISATAKRELWSRPGQGIATSEGRFVLAIEDGFAGIDPATGRSLWQIANLGQPRAAVENGILAVRVGDDVVEAYDLAGGRLRFRYEMTSDD